MLKVEREFEHKVFYAIGDRCGPFVGEARLGLSSLRSYEGILKQAQTWRSEPTLEYFAHVISGTEAARRVRGLVEARLRASEKHKRGSWWAIDGAELCEMAICAAADSGVRLLTMRDAHDSEMERLHEIMSGML